ncbi:histidine phosphatase family protein [Salipiger mangrovisoli]|uniref:histidine phosphatase family protein n=1 Tax=Salipiger mangrovisoli TaxID=2865933 RepID=UPI001F11CD67|nr:histidine phosphatase family protein [Salipiger mangrovisoli]
MQHETPGSGELILIRHAPIAEPGRLCGRTDLPARIAPAPIAALRAALPRPGQLVTSPAQRCRQTSEALWPDIAARPDPLLWEQDFGSQDGLRIADLPDLGPLDGPDLALWTPPGGESFSDLCARVGPALAGYGKAAARIAAPVVLVVHAGVIRAALSQLCAAPHAGLVFEIPTLSVTRLRCGAEGPFSVIEAGRT